jgi:PAS domain S-box-containing protein
MAVASLPPRIVEASATYTPSVEQVAVLRTDGDGVIIFGEGDEHPALGFDPRLAAGRTVWQAFAEHPEAVDAAHEALAGRPARASLTEHDRSIVLRFEPRRDGRGRVVGCAVLGIDVAGAARELARTEVLFAEAQRVAHIGCWEWDATRNVVAWTEELYAIYGLARGEFGGTYEAFLSHVHPDDRERTRAVVFDAFRRGTPFIYDHRIVRPDGVVRMLHTRGAVAVDSAGKPVRLIGCCWDVTDLWEADRELERSLSLLQATLDSTADGIVVVDLEGKVVSINRRALALWDIPERLAASGDLWALVDHVGPSIDDPEGFVRNERELLADRETERLDTIRFKDGRVFERYSQPYLIGGAVAGRVCSFRDVTERERLLRTALLVSDASRLLASIDVEQALEAVARASLPFLGDACAIDMLGDGEGPRRLLALSLPGAEPAQVELPPGVLAGKSSIYTAGGRSCMAVPLAVRGTVVGALTFVARPQRRYGKADLDLVEELARRAALAIENARLHQRSREALRARDEFFDIASHEIRGPVGSLHLAVENLLRARDPKTTASLVGVIERADRRLAQFVDELFSVSQLRAGQLRFELEDVDLGDVTRDVVSRFSKELLGSGSSLSMTTKGPLVGVWDPSRLAQVIANLLSNAIKFGLGRPIEVALEGDDAKARLEVVDHGIGIATERREAIFRPFERAAAARHYGGLGLGLYISRTIVEGLGGSIRVESEAGRGSTFLVELPKRGEIHDGADRR